jgi:hypothetical protein
VNSTLLLTLRRLRAPIILLIVVFAIGMVGLVLIPGVDEHGEPWHMSMFQAFYFTSYTASTIGFGEIPREFTDRQRLWVTFMIYASVIGWAYLLANLMSLGRDQAVRRALVERRFRRRVDALVEPFYLICGFGETGLLIAHALDLRGRRFVVVEIDETRAQEVDLMDFHQVPLALAGDVVEDGGGLVGPHAGRGAGVAGPEPAPAAPAALVFVGAGRGVEGGRGGRGSEDGAEGVPQNRIHWRETGEVLVHERQRLLGLPPGVGEGAHSALLPPNVRSPKVAMASASARPS